MRSIKSRFLPLLVVGASVIVTPVLSSQGVHADPIQDKRDEVERITDHLEELERQRDLLTEQYTVATQELRDLEAQVEQAQAAVEAQRAAVAELQGVLGDVAVQAFMGAGGTGLGPMFSDSSSYSDDLVRAEYSRTALATGTATSDDLERELNKLAEEEQDLEDKRAAAEDKRTQVEQAQSAAEAQTDQYEQARSRAESELGDLIREEEERRARESYERMMRQAQEQAEAQRQAQVQAQAQAQAQATSARPTSSSQSSSSNQSSSSQSQSSGGGGGQSSSGGGGGQSSSGGGGGGGGYPAASSRAGTAVNAALSQQGTPYIYAASNPGVGFDCSGLTAWAWEQVGVYLPHQSAQQYGSTAHVPASEAQPGDLIFFYSPISHVGLYIGGGQMVHAPNSGSVVKVVSVNWGNVVGVGRPG